MKDGGRNFAKPNGSKSYDAGIVKFLGQAVLILLTVVILTNFALESILDRSSRRIASGNASTKTTLQLAAVTVGIPRLWRRISYYDDAHLVSLSALYVKSGRDTDIGIWGIRKAMSILDDLLAQGALAEDLRYFTRLRRLMIASRAPSLFGAISVNALHELRDLESMSARLNLSPESRAYLSIERMIHAANSGAPRNELDSAYLAAISGLGTVGGQESNLNSVKFRYYKGYAYCVAGIESGASDITEALQILSQRSGQFEEAMFLNWDWAMLGNLRGQNPAGRGVCKPAVDGIVLGHFVH